MGYWSCHPMCGDYPLDCKSDVEYYAIECLLSNIAVNEAAESGPINEIPKNLINWVRNFKDTQDVLDTYWERDDIPYEDLFNTYKYEIINNFLDEDSAFVVPFLFIDYGIRVRSSYVKYLSEMTGDGDAKHRGYPSWEGENDHPTFYAEIVKKYANTLFDENNTDLNSDEFINIHGDELQQLEKVGLLETILSSNSNKLVNVK